MQTNNQSIIPSLSFLMLGMLLFVLLGTLGTPFTDSRFVIAVIVLIILYYSSKAFLRFEKIPFTVVHLIPNKGTLTRLGLGIVIGVIIVGVMLFALFTLTGLEIERNEIQSLLPFIVSSVVIIPLALMEELLFRGYAFFRLTQTLNIRWVLLITSILFALYHFNGSQSIGYLLLGPGIWGVVFGVAAYLSKSIAVPLGIHISANILQALFGLKTNFNSMWTVLENSNPLVKSLDPEYLGLMMQISLLLVTIVVFELTMKLKKHNRS